MTTSVEKSTNNYNWFESNKPYVKPEQEKNILLHSYKGGSDSMYYTYVQSPVCDYLVTFLPVNLAPNVITVLGISCVFASIVMLHCLYGFDFDGPSLDSWFCYIAGLLYFSNTVLDNMDGKQARRTGSGSPMGMLFDHGSDAVTACMSCILMGRMLHVGTGLPGLAAFFIPTLPFYWVNLQEFYTGEMTLPNLTGPDDT
jgi:ethanolaminephosphotransferase